jgi:hypothetical protein
MWAGCRRRVRTWGWAWAEEYEERGDEPVQYRYEHASLDRVVRNVHKNDARDGSLKENHVWKGKQRCQKLESLSWFWSTKASFNWHLKSPIQEMYNINIRT